MKDWRVVSENPIPATKPSHLPRRCFPQVAGFREAKYMEGGPLRMGKISSKKSLMIQG